MPHWRGKRNPGLSVERTHLGLTKKGSGGYTKMLYGAVICKMYMEGERQGHVPDYPSEADFRRSQRRYNG